MLLELEFDIFHIWIIREKYLYFQAFSLTCF